jgi:uncharacterized repeat protein (TIGR01451 family)
VIRDLKHTARGRRGLAAVNVGYDFSFATPIQTFFVPFPETDMVNDMLKVINGAADNLGNLYVRGQMVSLVSVAISTDNTVIWYDHWEDSYEKDITSGITSNYTQVWGDGKASNGCRPGLTVCQDSDDYLNAGESFVMENMMPVPRTSTNWFESGLKIDGGDKIMASFPISMTRGTYSEYPGSLLAGAAEMYDTDNWGLVFESPMGNDVVTATESFEHTRLFIMSGSDGNVVTLPTGLTTVLNQGQSISFNVKQANAVVATKPIQVYLCAGDIGSNYEMRFFSVRPKIEWSDSYLSPVGDGYGRSKIILYNPNTVPMNIQFTYISNNSTAATTTTTLTVDAKKHLFSPVVPTSSGALVKSVTAGQLFTAMSMTDTETTVGDGVNAYTLNGQAFEWGATLPALNKLTPQVLVGWGYGCTLNDCQGQTERSVVWVSVVEDADLYIDYKNAGTGYSKLPMKKLQSARIRDKSDTDMSGAIIFATKPGTGPTGIPVDIATAWGQDASVSYNTQAISLDLGTTIVPFSTIRVKKSVDKAIAYPGDILTYTIRIQNVGQVDFKAGTFQIVDPAAFQGRYVPDTTKYSADGGVTTFQLADDVNGTLFPLDGAGLPAPRDLARRGGTHLVTFQFLVAPELLTTSTLVNTGYLDIPIYPNITFTATTNLKFSPAIKVDNTVYEGDNGVAGCNLAVESLTSVNGAKVTYCFTITNTGSTFLDGIKLTNADLGITNTMFNITKLAPGASTTVSRVGTITTTLKNTVTVTGRATFHSGGDIPNVPDVAATDPSDVKTVAYAANVTIANTVYAGNNGPRECEGAGVEKIIGAGNSSVTYCFKITNTGNTYLTSLRLTDPLLTFTKTDFLPLAPNASIWVSYPSTISANLVNIATIVGTPSTAAGVAVAGLTTVTASDPSEVAKRIDGDVRAGDKPLPETCMQTNWEDAGNSQNLVCRAKEVFLNSLVTSRTSCTVGSSITLSVNASIHFNAARYDPAWYVATDGGDALTGTCAINGLVQGNTYSVTDGKGGPVVGRVSWNEDFKGGNDKCGDVLMNGGGGADIEVPFLKNTVLKCSDDNNDGNMDVSVCFSWRVPGTDGFCTLARTEVGTVGLQADAYPGTPSKCFCTRVDIPTVTVVKTSDPISPC